MHVRTDSIHGARQGARRKLASAWTSRGDVSMSVEFMQGPGVAIRSGACWGAGARDANVGIDVHGGRGLGEGIWCRGVDPVHMALSNEGEGTQQWGAAVLASPGLLSLSFAGWK